MKLEGKTAIVTGGSLGLGREIARTFVEQGCSVYLCARTIEPLLDAIGYLERHAPPGFAGHISGEPGNVERHAESIVHSAIMHMGYVDILVNNAGIHGPKDLLEDADFYRWVEAMQVNLYGPAMMMRAVLPHMKIRGHGKIINISGGGATKPMYGMSAYATSKAALVRLTENVALEQAGTGINVNAVAPGALNTRLMSDILQAGPEKVGEGLYQEKVKQRESGGDSIQRAADLCVWLASDDSNGVTGRLISARWDSWDGPDFKTILDVNPTLYTLRRKD